jgi:hypothetical protein
MYLLTELLPPDRRIDSKAALTRYFGRKGSSPDYVLADDPFYQPAKWIVRLWDGQICEGLRERYGDCDHLSVELIMTVLDKVIAERQAAKDKEDLTATDQNGNDQARANGGRPRSSDTSHDVALKTSSPATGGPT